MGPEEGTARMGMSSAARSPPSMSWLSDDGAVFSNSAMLSEVMAVDNLTSTKRKKLKKKLVRFPQDDCEFYSNIWTVPASTAGTTSIAQGCKFIDISQVAYALAMSDYKYDYEDVARVNDENIWTMEDLEDAAVNKEDTRSPESPIPAEFQSSHSTARRTWSQASNQMHQPPSQFRTLERLLSLQGVPTAETLPVAPPSKFENTRFIFSAVLSRHDLRDRWSSKFLLSLHEPVRHALYVIDRFLDRAHSTDISQGWNTATFFEWFADYFCEYIEAQQRIKATVLRPLVQISYTTKREIAECYDEIIFMMNAILARETEFPISAASCVGSWQRRLHELQEDIRKLNVVLFHVLNLEERTLQPALLATFNEHTFYKFVMPRVYSAARPKKIVLPWIIERSKVWGDDKDTTMFKKQLSFPARIMYDRVWYPHFNRHVIAAMKILDVTLTDMDNDPDSDSWFQCTIQ